MRHTLLLVGALVSACASPTAPPAESAASIPLEVIVRPRVHGCWIYEQRRPDAPPLSGRDSLGTVWDSGPFGSTCARGIARMVIE